MAVLKLQVSLPDNLMGITSVRKGQLTSLKLHNREIVQSSTETPQNSVVSRRLDELGAP